MSTRLVVGAFRASRSSHSRTLIPPPRRLARLSLVGCLALILSMVQWSVIDTQQRDPSSLACGRSKNRFIVLAFQPLSRFRKRHGQPFTANHNRKRSPSPSVPTPLFFFDKDSNEIRFPRTRTHIAKRYHRKSRNKIGQSLLFGGSSNENGDPSSDNNNNKNRLNSMRRIGGRSRRPRKKDVDDSTIDKSSSSSSSNFIERIKNRLPSVPLLLVTLLVLNLLKNLFFGGGADYYYYSYSSSTVYETQTNSDGTREVFRNENSDLKTNIPGFTNRDAADRGGAGNLFYFDE